ncbi:autophagy protein Apg6 [Cladochytrium replicatum]|nr:autophagy protein Apg6 [Cladochytrium replicatum]
MLSQSQLKGVGSDDHSRLILSHRLRVVSKLFDMASAISDVEHPLCHDCADELGMKLDKRLSEVRKEKDTYAEYLLKLEEEEKAGNQPTKVDLDAILAQEKQSIQLLLDLESEKDALVDELHELESELQQLEQLETNYWLEVNQLQTAMDRHREEREALVRKNDYITKQLDMLRKTNVYNDTFRIWHDGAFGTINGFRLGRLKSQLVDWSEINAGMGQALLLLDTLATKLNFTFKTYRLVPMGSFSRIERIEPDKASFELYGSGIPFWNRRFDGALVAFLNCLQQLGDYAELKDVKFRLPYRILKDKIGDTSIRVQVSNEEGWTRALKFTLINLKWLLAFSCNQIAASK